MFSLGFSVDILHPFGHTHEHLDEMIGLVKKHNLMNRSAGTSVGCMDRAIVCSTDAFSTFPVIAITTGVVLAINARLLVKNMVPFETFLEHFPSSQLLVWTATGEPPISQRKIDRIRKHFDSHGTLDRVGFDCKASAADCALVVLCGPFFLLDRIHSASTGGRNFSCRNRL